MRLEILTSYGFETVIKDMKLHGQKSYQYLPTEDSYWANTFEVWELPDYELELLTMFTSDETWNNRYPRLWWRYAEDCNLHCHRVDNVLIHGKPIYAWLNDTKDDVCITEDDDSQLYLAEFNHSYQNVLAYCVDEFGASTPTNVNAVCAGLAKLNNMRLSELFQKYMG